MLVLAAMPDIQYHKLRRAVAVRFAVAHARSWDTVLASIRRRGCALEAAQGMMDWALREHDVRLLRISIAPNNTPSLAMAANRAERPS